VTELYFTNLLAMAKRLVCVWMLANAPLTTLVYFFLANIGQLMDKQNINQNFG
jgi:hypothetical protein